MRILENVPLAPLTTLEVGGPARFFAEAKSIQDVNEAVTFSRQHSLPLFVLGGGSNLVISDDGWPGLVLKIAISNISRRASSNIFDVGAGVEWDKFVALAVAQKCAGIECLSGIPGSTGATPVQNVGAYGQEVGDTIDAIQVLDLRDCEIRELCHEACGFSYRTSIFNASERGRFIVLNVSFNLAQDGVSQIRYVDLKNYFAGSNKPPSLAATRDAVRQIRSSKGMLIEPGAEDSRSAGSFFKNPVLDDARHSALQQRAEVRGLRVPAYPALETQHKVSAAWLVENSGFQKGYSRGPAGISHKHALAIVNRGGARSEDIIGLKNEIVQKVAVMWDLTLEPEPVMVGF